MSENFQVLIMAGGKGTRMYSSLPKVLHSLCGQTLLARVLGAAAPLRPQGVTVVVGFQAQMVDAELERLKAQPHIQACKEIRSVLQSEQLGTGHAAMVAESSFGNDPLATVLIVPGDAPLLREEELRSYRESHRASGAQLSVVTAQVPDAAGFGRIIRSKSGSVQAIVEKKDCTPEQLAITEINSSIYLVQLGFLREALGSLTRNNAQGEYYLTDIVAYAVKNGISVNGICTPDFRRVLGANDRAELSELEAFRRAEINTQLMKSGVTLEDPTTTYIEEGVAVGADSFLGAGTRLRGNTKLGERVHLEGNSVLRDCSIENDVLIKYSCHLEGVTVARESFVGPFARLRQGTVVHERVHVGNFVEAKNTEFHAEAKANHVSYLGDSDIGSGSNIGAGTIFCNYDGVNKNRTSIEEKVFVGSNSTLVAPVKISTGSYVAAGSVITEEVPPQSLALGRARQINKTGWQRPKKEEKR